MSANLLYKKFLSEDLSGKIDVLSHIYNTDLNGKFKFIVLDAMRSNIVDLFEHVAFENNYAENFFDEREFNQLVLKAIFLELDIFKINGIEKRKNPQLKTMVTDYKEERELANRIVPNCVFAYLSMGELNENV